MADLVVLCKSRNFGLYVNLICLAVDTAKIAGISFVFIDFQSKDQLSLENTIFSYFEKLARAKKAYKEVMRLIRSRKTYSIEYSGLKTLIKEQFSKNDYFEITPLIKEDSIEIATFLLARSANHIRSLQFKSYPPKVYHETEDPKAEFTWANINNIADQYASYIEIRESKSFLSIFAISFFITILISVAKQYYEKVDIVSGLINDFGGFFALIFAFSYLSERVVSYFRLQRKLWASK